MERIAGEALPRRLLRDAEYERARSTMTEQLGAILAQIHRIDPEQERLRFLVRPEPGQSAAQFELERYEQIYRLITPESHPAFELAMRWLRQSAAISAAMRRSPTIMS